MHGRPPREQVLDVSVGPCGRCVSAASGLDCACHGRGAVCVPNPEAAALHVRPRLSFGSCLAVHDEWNYRALPCAFAGAVVPRSHIPATLGRWEQYLAVRRRFLSRIFMTMFYGFSLAHCMGMLWLYTARKYPEASGFVPTAEQLALPDASLYLVAVYWGAWWGRFAWPWAGAAITFAHPPPPAGTTPRHARRLRRVCWHHQPWRAGTGSAGLVRHLCQPRRRAVCGLHHRQRAQDGGPHAEERHRAAGEAERCEPVHEAQRDAARAAGQGAAVPHGASALRVPRACCGAGSTDGARGCPPVRRDASSCTRSAVGVERRRRR